MEVKIMECNINIILCITKIFAQENLQIEFYCVGTCTLVCTIYVCVLNRGGVTECQYPFTTLTMQSPNNCAYHRKCLNFGKLNLERLGKGLGTKQLMLLLSGQGGEWQGYSPPSPLIDSYHTHKAKKSP